MDTPTFGNRFATDLPEMAVPWQGADFPDPTMLVLDEQLATELGFAPDWLRGPEGVRLLVGAEWPTGATPVAQAYAGHQFGGYSPRLGDGRALLIGELTVAGGGLRDLHLKGSGRTPFARAGDGLAAVGPMLREYVVSRAMHALGIPTTRSLAVVSTGRKVRREENLPGAVLARVAASHLRVGSFQYARATGDAGLLKRLADHAIDRHHPQARDAERPYLALFEAVVAVQAGLIAQWMHAGFIHGVMNTDNMTISGETIDYGPCAFLDVFDPATVYSSIDSGGRYAYGNQPPVAHWNLARLAESLLPLFDDDQDKAIALATDALGGFGAHYDTAWIAGMRAKLGLTNAVPDEDVRSLGEDLLVHLRDNRLDYTSTFRDLDAAISDAAWLARWHALDPDRSAAQRRNPIYIPRNHLVEEALTAATGGDLEPLRELISAIDAPFDERPGLERYAEPAPDGFGACYQTFCGT
ncbi:YdiU family protein [Actinoplanes sp. DH11]|uniref:protein adenylyltransferase SelO n=1 Tax=Actinoplanes sp. DH11 TaxID=2857011 RepID=UPI001E2CBF7D|nr:YdiU family protein [Actinoplanes sp. DH11]